MLELLGLLADAGQAVASSGGDIAGWLGGAGGAGGVSLAWWLSAKVGPAKDAQHAQSIAEQQARLLEALDKNDEVWSRRLERQDQSLDKMADQIDRLRAEVSKLRGAVERTAGAGLTKLHKAMADE